MKGLGVGIYKGTTQVIRVPKNAITLDVAVSVENYLKRCKSIVYYGALYDKLYYLYWVAFNEWKPSKVDSFMIRLDKKIQQFAND